ncbi:MAG: hypothetical protein OEN23_13260 [Paracoccaceae bacterium]|nr:hypothetical protein [Paracoccaceae bacterium]
MNRAAIGVIWGLSFIVLESIQFVFFGNIFQRMSSVQFGFLVFGISTISFIGWAAWARPAELRLAFRGRRNVAAMNIAATFSWIMFLIAVQLIEPAIAYTIGAGAMPLTAWLVNRAGVPEGETMRNRFEATGNVLILAAIVYLGAITIAGQSGFVRGGTWVAVMGVTLAFVEGAIFTWMLIFGQRLDRAGVGPAVAFGLRFPLYVVVAGGLAAAGFDHKAALPAPEIALIVAIGLALVVPPLYALQRAVALISTLTISALTALGPFIIFGLQMIEGRVAYSSETLMGLGVYFAGATLAAFGAVRASVGAAGRAPGQQATLR